MRSSEKASRPGPDCLEPTTIEAYLDGELTGTQGSKIEAHLRRCSFCANELALAAEIRGTLRQLPQVKCPTRVTRAVLAQARADLRAERYQRWRAWLSNWVQPAWRPALATAAVVGLLVLALFSAKDEQPAMVVSPEELARAEAEVKWTLAYVGEIGRRTGLLVREEVIATQVVEPVKRAVATLGETQSRQ